MSFDPPKDWVKEGPDLYIYKDGTRIHKTTYNSKTGWFLIPVNLDESVTEFEATPEGRDRAFDHFQNQLVTAKPKKGKVVAGKGKKKKSEAVEEPEEEEEADAEEEPELGEDE